MRAASSHQTQLLLLVLLPPGCLLPDLLASCCWCLNSKWQPMQLASSSEHFGVKLTVGPEVLSGAAALRACLAGGRPALLPALLLLGWVVMWALLVVSRMARQVPYSSCSSTATTGGHIEGHQTK